MSLVERCKTKYQKRKVLYNLAGVMALTGIIWYWITIGTYSS